MARPRKNNADYFSHDSGMRNDPKIRALRGKFGLEGYSIWNMLLELLTSQDGFKYRWDDLNIELAAGDFDIDASKLEEVIKYMERLQLVSIKDNVLFSNNHIGRFAGLLAKRNRDNDRYDRQKDQDTNIDKVSAGENSRKVSVSAVESAQSIVNNTKEQENKRILFRQRFFSVLEIFYFKNFKNPIAVTNAFFNHYEGVGWKNSHGLDIENVDSVAENWENKTTEGANCPEHLLAKWKVMFGILKNNTKQYNKFLLIRPAKLENKTFVIRGKQKDIEAIESDKDLLQVWKNALFMTFGKVTIQYELDKQIIA